VKARRDRAGAPAGYSRLQIALHWTIAALIVFQLVYNAPMQAAFDSRLDGADAVPEGGALVHIVVGTTVLVLAAVRLAVRFIRGAPPAHADNPPLVIWVGYATHFALYVMIFAMPITGLAAWFAGAPVVAEVHEIGRLVLIALIGLHVLGALAEHFVFRNDGLLRMLRPARSRA
jgi:cytochrome b561